MDSLTWFRHLAQITIRSGARSNVCAKCLNPTHGIKFLKLVNGCWETNFREMLSIEGILIWILVQLALTVCGKWPFKCGTITLYPNSLKIARFLKDLSIWLHISGFKHPNGVKRKAQDVKLVKNWRSQGLCSFSYVYKMWRKNK